MKPKPLRILATSAGAAAIAAGVALAIEAPEDNAAPPRAEDAPAAAEPKNAEAPEARGAFLGVISGAVPAALAEHLDLKPGQGVLVGSVMPDGPAAKAGLATHDIITRVGDHEVGDPAALSKAVTAHQPGDTIKIGRIHKGVADTVDVTLGERPGGAQAWALPAPLHDLRLDGVPEEFAERLRGMIEGNVGGFEFPEAHAVPNIDQAVRDMQEKMRRAMEGIDALELPGKDVLDLKSTHSAKVKMVDDEGSVEFESKDGGREVTVRDKDGKVQWSGPWDTEQDKAVPPDDIRERIDRLKLDTTFKGGGLRFRFNGGGVQEDE